MTMGNAPVRRPPGPPAKRANADGTYPMARYSLMLAKEICRRIANGEAWISMANGPGMPSYSTLFSWRDKHPEFAAMLVTARDIAADYKAERALEVAMETTPATVSADRLKVGTLMLHAARAAPKRWGTAAEKVEPERRIIFEVRDFVPVRRDDGTLFTRELLPDGSYIDADD